MSSPTRTSATTAFRQHDDDRRRDEARAATLQSQIDELRQALRESLSRQSRQEEQLKQYEGSVAQNRLVLEQIRQEAHQSAQARALDENRTRQHIGDIENRFEDAVRPIRSLQAHVAELLDASRQKVDNSGVMERRYDELATAIEHFAAQNDRTTVINHQLRDSIDVLRTEIEQIHRDILRTEDTIKIVDQDARRRVATVTETTTLASARIDELQADTSHLADLIDEVRQSIVHVDPTLEELRKIDDALREEFLKVQEKNVETHEMLRDRDDDLQHEADTRFAELRQLVEQRAERLAERIEDLTEQYRNLGFDIKSLAGELEPLRQVDAALRRDLWYLHEQRTRLRFEQIQQELDLVTAQRREAEVSDNNRAAPTPRARIQVPDVQDVEF
jgi:chromosome segregation ATPase